MNLPRLELKFKPNAPAENAQFLWIHETTLFITERPHWSSWTSLSFQISMNVKPNSTIASSSVSTPSGGSPVNVPPVSPSITLPASVRQIRVEVFCRYLVGAEPQRNLSRRSCREHKCICAVGTLCGHFHLTSWAVASDAEALNTLLCWGQCFQFHIPHYRDAQIKYDKRPIVILGCFSVLF